MAYFENILLLQNILLPYFCEKEPLKFIYEFFYKLNYEKYLTHLQPHGIIETYYKDTKTIEERKTYENERTNGLWKRWYENGQLYIKCTVKDEKINGLHEQWYEKGELYNRCNYKSGLCDGLREIWYSNGRLMLKTYYKNDEIRGSYKVWNENGKLIKNENYPGKSCLIM